MIRTWLLDGAGSFLFGPAANTLLSQDEVATLMMLLQQVAITTTGMTHIENCYAARLRSGGFRLTPQRQIILDTLCALGGHVPVTALVEAVQQQSPAIDRATVYRSISLFAELDLVISSAVEGVTVVEMAPGDGEGHGHLLCRVCGQIHHVPSTLFADLATEIAAKYSFSVDLSRQTIDGICRECAAQQAA